MSIRAILAFCVLALAITGHALALENTATSGIMTNAALENKLTLLKSLANAMEAKFSEQVSDTKDELKKATDKLTLLRVCNSQKKVYAPESAGADANGCVGVTSVPKVTISMPGYGHIPTTGTRSINMGRHDFCGFNTYSGPGGLDTHCDISPTNYTTEKPEWILWMADYTSDETHICAASCIDFD